MGWSGVNVSSWLVVALRGAWPAAPARPRRLAQTPPELGVYSPKKHGGAWYCNDVASFRSQLTSVTPIERTASATGVPCATSTSTWRSLETISSGLCLFVGIDPSSFGLEAMLQDGPPQWGRISPLRSGKPHPRIRARCGDAG